MDAGCDVQGEAAECSPFRAAPADGPWVGPCLNPPNKRERPPTGTVGERWEEGEGHREKILRNYPGIPVLTLVGACNRTDPMWMLAGSDVGALRFRKAAKHHVSEQLP